MESHQLSDRAGKCKLICKYVLGTCVHTYSIFLHLCHGLQWTNKKPCDFILTSHSTPQDSFYTFCIFAIILTEKLRSHNSQNINLFVLFGQF